MKNLQTRAVHAGQHPDRETGAVTQPIYQTSTFAYGSFDRGARIFAGEESGYVYNRFHNPTVRAFEEKLADLECADDAVAFASGMAAISSLVLATLKPGDEAVFVGPLYGGTEGVFRDLLQRFGVKTVNATERGDLEACITPATRMIYVESLTNPTLSVTDLAAVARLGRARNILTAVDNTFATPMLTQPIELGVDAVVHSATKFLGGHSDATGGVVAGHRELVARVRFVGLKQLGGCLGPHEAFLFLRGMKTLPLRMEASSAAAMRIAQYLAAHPKVARVYYPGLPSHPGHDVAKRQMRMFGGMLSVDLVGGMAAARVFLDHLELFTQAVSLGDTDSLACHVASTTHRGVPPEARLAQGITEGLIRMSIGLEHPDDLIEDLSQALEHVIAEPATALPNPHRV